MKLIPTDFNPWNSQDDEDTPFNDYMLPPQPRQEYSAAPVSNSDTSRSWGEAGTDTLAALGRGIISVPEALVGLADLGIAGNPWLMAYEKFSGNDIPTFTKMLADNGVDFAGIKKSINDNFVSEGLRNQQQDVSEAFDRSFTEGVSEVLSNPGVIGDAVFESLPQMVGTIGVTKKAAASIFNEAMEGAIKRGASSEVAKQVAQQAVKDSTPRLMQISSATEGGLSLGQSLAGFAQDGELTGREIGGSLVAGGATAGFGYLGGKLGTKLGLGDVETGAATGRNDGLISGFLKGSVQEGFLEELPQSLGEQVGQNIGMGRDLTEGLGQAGVMGALSGAAMGGPFGAYGAMTQGPQASNNPAPSRDAMAELRDIQSMRDAIEQMRLDSTVAPYAIDEAVNQLNARVEQARSAFPTFDFSLSIQEAQRQAELAGGDPLDIAGAGARAASENAPSISPDLTSGPQPITSPQFEDVPNTELPRRTSADRVDPASIDRAIMTAREMGFVDEEVRLTTAKRLFQEAQIDFAEGRNEVAARKIDRAQQITDELLTRSEPATVTDQFPSVLEPEVLPTDQPAVVDAEREGVTIDQYANIGIEDQNRERSRSGALRIEDQGVIYAEPNDPLPGYGDEYTGSPVDQVSVTSGQPPAQTTSQEFNAALEARRQATREPVAQDDQEQTSEPLGIEDQRVIYSEPDDPYRGSTNRLPSFGDEYTGSPVDEVKVTSGKPPVRITSEEFDAARQARLQALRTPVSQRTEEQTNAISTVDAVRAGEIEVVSSPTQQTEMDLEPARQEISAADLKPKRAEDFSNTGDYDVALPDGSSLKIFRDTDQFSTPSWYIQRNDGSMDWAGSTRNEALERIASEYNSREQSTPETPVASAEPLNWKGREAQDDASWMKGIDRPIRSNSIIREGDNGRFKIAGYRSEDGRQFALFDNQKFVGNFNSAEEAAVYAEDLASNNQQPSMEEGIDDDQAMFSVRRNDNLPPAENAQRTQITGTTPTYRKAKDVMDKVAPEGRSIDFGAGKGVGAQEIGFESYEPFPNESFSPDFTQAQDVPSNSYQRVTNLNVLNVVPKDVRDGIVRDIGRVLAVDGTAIITTRGKDVMTSNGTPGPEPMSIITTRETYQKGFTKPELLNYVQETLGPDFEVKPLNLGPAGVTVKKLRASEEPSQSSGVDAVSIFSGAERPATKLKGKKQVAQYLQERTLSRIGTPRDIANEADRQSIAEDLAREAIYEFENSDSAVEWYDQTIDRTIEMLAIKHPEIKSDEGSKAQFLMALAITSQNMAVPDNLAFAEVAYESVKTTGRFPSEGKGDKKKSMEANFKKANVLLETMTPAEINDFLSTEFIVKDLNKVTRQMFGKVAETGELKENTVFGSAIFGPKIGQGFYTNLRGDFSPVTMDMWFMRTIGRLSGTLMGSSEGKIQNAYDRVGRAISDKPLSNESILESARKIKSEHESNYRKYGDEYKSGERTKSEAVKASENLIKLLDGTNDAPSNGTQRNQLRDIVSRTIEIFERETGQSIEPAAFQALVWYPEQDLYKSLGVNLRHVRQDYATATENVLRKQGVSDGDLRLANERVRQRRELGAGGVRSDGLDGRADQAGNAGVDSALPGTESEQVDVQFSPRRQPASVDTALARIREALRGRQAEAGNDAGIEVVELDSLSGEQRRAADLALEAARAFQKSGVVNFVQFGEGVAGFNGATVNGQIFIDTNSEQPHLVVLGHELTHVLRREYPDLYQQLEDMIIPRATAREDSARVHGFDMDSREGREEYVSDVVGNRFGETEFWRAMAEANPKGFRRMAQVARSLLEKVVRFFDSRGVQQGDAVQDLNRIRLEIAKVMSDYKNRIDADQKTAALDDSQIPAFMSQEETPMFSVRRNTETDAGLGNNVGSVDYQDGFSEVVQSPESPTPETNFNQENRRLREQDVTLWDKVKSEVKRQLKPGGLLPNSVFNAKIDRDNKLAAVEFDTVVYVNALEKAVKQSMGSSFESLGESDKARIQSSLSGDMDPQLPRPVQEAIAGMRNNIDRMSSEYTTILQSQAAELFQQLDGPTQFIARAMERAIASGDQASADAIMDEAKRRFAEVGGGNVDAAMARANQYLSKKDLINTITANAGEYVHRSYKAFDDPNWFSKIPDPVINDARAYLSQRMLAAGMNTDQVNARVEVILNDIVKEGTAYDSMESYIKESKLGARDLSILKQRKQIAPEIMALLGEYTDARINYSKTTAKMARLIWNTKFLDRVKDIGMGEFLFTEDNRPPNTTQIAVEGNKSMEPLNGLYAPRDVAKAFSDMGKSDWGPLLEGLVRVNGAIKYGKTVLAPTTTARNFMSAAFFALNNGHFDLTKTAKSISVVREYFSKGGDASKLAYLRKLKDLGVVYDTPYAGEMMRLLEESKLLDIEAQESDSGAQRTIKDIASAATRFYQFGDDFWKIVGFENEKANLIDSGMDPVSAEKEAANRVRNTYPTYSMVGKGVNTLRRFPLAGTFVSFPAEIIRTSYNILKIASEDMKDPARRSLGVKRLAGMAVTSGTFLAAAKMAKEMFDVSDEEEEAVRAMSPPWQENSTFMFAGRDEKGRLRYFDLSFLDPYNYFKRPFVAAIRDQPWEESFSDAARDLVAPFFGADILASSVFEVLANEKSTGSQIYYNNDGTIEKAADIANHISKSIQPGFVGNLQRIAKAYDGEVTSYGKQYTMEDEMLALIGWRASTFDPKAALGFRVYDIKQERNNASAVLRKALNDSNERNGEGVDKALDRALSMRERTFTKMSRMIDAARSSGMSDSDIRVTINASGLSKLDIAYLLKGDIPPLIIDSDDIGRAYQQTVKTLGEERARRIVDRYRLARDELRNRN